MAVNCYITFYTIHNAIKAEEKLKKSGFRFKMVPVPRSISSSCGTALQCSCEQAAAVEQILKQQQVEFEATHRLEEKDLKLSLFSRFKKGG